jgi:UDP-N-acetylmuramyl pentapeptide phosphotransferase/UDP-N-acetylglucosamine-1-phosphate transferase
MAVPVFEAEFATSFLANAVNVIDGLNGLSVGTIIIIVGATAGVACSIGDRQLMTISMVFAVKVFGLGMFNFPLGKIFLLTMVVLISWVISSLF